MTDQQKSIDEIVERIETTNEKVQRVLKMVEEWQKTRGNKS